MHTYAHIYPVVSLLTQLFPYNLSMETPSIRVLPCWGILKYNKFNSIQRLLDAGLRAHPAKTRFFDAMTEYCGHAVSADGLHKLPSKVDAIRDAPQPTNVSQLRSFLCVVNYYARFLPNLSMMLHPLNRLLQHDSTWHWTEACTAAFDEVKRQIGSDLVLTHFHPNLPLHVASDAPPYGLGAVLSYSMPDGTERPIAFASRTLNTLEQNYSQIDKEAIGIVWSLKSFIHTFAVTAILYWTYRAELANDPSFRANQKMNDSEAVCSGAEVPEYHCSVCDFE